MKSWEEIRDWRRAKRAELRSRRLGVPREAKDRLRAIATRLVREHVPDISIACTGFYWPFKGEVDLRHFVRGLVADGGEAALPVVVERAHPLEFWSWRPHAKLQRGIWNIPIPADRAPVRPTLLLVPLVGFDGAGYRLGYGGGYYDRTLAQASPRPMTIGIGYELGRLDSIHPQPHDIPLDAIVTENGFTWIRKPDGAAHGAAAETGLSNETRMDREMLLDLLGEMLVAERAGARSVGRMSNEAPSSAVGLVLREVARDEARFCAMLTFHINRLGGTPSLATGAFYDKVMALRDADQRLDLLNRGQGWVVRRLQEALPRISDAALRADLQDMLDVHARNIATCARLGPLPKLEQQSAHAAQGN
ncbi:MAG TPA: 5-formyltetrahydrofolate cyclo-ligase [Dongiaceae bacterium]|nr:5-formyltetrahydrofolate cyclo-ligase [Dongiaceae bacterium]